MKLFYRIFAGVLAFFVLSGCSINRMATGALADALTGTGSSTVFTGDDDPQLVGDALPFAIKMYEALLNEAPDHRGLILTTGSLFVMYANAFVQGPVEFLPSIRYEERQAARQRARKLYIRGINILLAGIEKKFPGFREASVEEGNLAPFLAEMEEADVPLLYWIAAGTLSAFSLDPFDFSLGKEVPDCMAYIDRAYELDPGFNAGALDDFYVLAYASLPPAMGGNPSRVEIHFRRALEKSGGKLAGPYVSYAQAVALPAQNYDAFRSCLQAAKEIDVDADPQNRLVNIISQRKAQELLNRAGDYFFLTEDGELDAEAYQGFEVDLSYEGDL
ncbi:MAG: TRAP transporter TatT component family protein [Treponema sp.]|nr:TRAP transporter TatT component family protein [Treponema sp.]